MMTTMTPECYAFDSPATYQICVQGAIAVEWTNRLQGMVIRVIASAFDVIEVHSCSGVH
jgi:hypothetical protein